MGVREGGGGGAYTKYFNHSNLMGEKEKLIGSQNHAFTKKLGPASDGLQSLIDSGESSTFDFVFIDADKPGYDDYYEKCLVLLKQGGVIAFDNTLQNGSVLDLEKNSESLVAMRKLNKKLRDDTTRVFVVQLNLGDGYTLATKL